MMHLEVSRNTLESVGLGLQRALFLPDSKIEPEQVVKLVADAESLVVRVTHVSWITVGERFPHQRSIVSVEPMRLERPRAA